MLETTRRRILALAALTVGGTGLPLGASGQNSTTTPGGSNRQPGQAAPTPQLRDPGPAPQAPVPARDPAPAQSSNPLRSVQVVGSWEITTFGSTATARPAAGALKVAAGRLTGRTPPMGGSGELKLTFASNAPAERAWETTLVVSENFNALLGHGGERVRVLADDEEIAVLTTTGEGSAVFDLRTKFGPRLAGLAKVARLSATLQLAGEEIVVFDFAPAETGKAMDMMVAEATRIGRLVQQRNGTQRPRPSNNSNNNFNNPQCFVTTACCTLIGLDDDCFELAALRRFRDRVLIRMPGGPADIALYYRTAPAILAEIVRRGEERYLLAVYFTHILPSAVAASLGLEKFPRWLYGSMMRRLLRRYAR